jgi:hypothetical protein
LLTELGCDIPKFKKANAIMAELVRLEALPDMRQARHTDPDANSFYISAFGRLKPCSTQTAASVIRTARISSLER